MRFAKLLCAAALLGTVPAAAHAATFISVNDGLGGPNFPVNSSARTFKITGSFNDGPPWTASNFGDWSTGDYYVPITFPTQGEFTITGALDPTYEHVRYNTYLDGVFFRQSNVSRLTIMEDSLRFLFQDEDGQYFRGAVTVDRPDRLIVGYTQDGIPRAVNGTYDVGNGLTLVISGVPEPSTWALMILGFGVVGGAMRRTVRYQASYS